MKKILIVEDEEDVAETIKAILRKEGYHTESVCNGRECLERVSKDIPKIVFLDIMMPGMDGYEVAKQLRRMHGDKIRIIFVSIKLRQDVDMKEADGFIQKPFTVEEIITVAKGMSI